jgi:multisubunit Na+/H+ antiporter MnhE subunit
MKDKVFDLMAGSVISFIPLYIVTKYFFENKIDNNDFNYANYVKFLPFKIALSNVLLFMAIEKIAPNNKYNFIILGVIMSVIISLFTRSFNDIPEKVVKSKNNNMYHLYITSVFIITYLIITQIRASLLIK